MIRTLYIAAVCCLFLMQAGCKEPKQEPVWDDVKIGDLAGHDPNESPEANLLRTIDINVLVYEIPAENIDKLTKISNQLFVRPLRLTNYPAFSDNSFFVRFGPGDSPDDLLSETLSKLRAAGGQKATNVSIMLSSGQSETFIITGIDGPRTVYFIGQSGEKEGARIGPGIIGLRIRTDKIEGVSGVCKVVVYPVFSPLIQSAVPKLDERAKLREFQFNAAAFGLNMSPGDFVLFGPEEFLGDRATLGFLLFSNPRGSMFLSEGENKLPELKPAVRVYLFVCTRISD